MIALPLILGIVNVTPDSFSDGGLAATTEKAVARGMQLLDDGADWLDIGGESTRPGAAEVPEREEIARVVPVIAALKRLRPEVTLCVDTRKGAVAAAALAAGAGVVNDVTGFTWTPGMADIAAAADAGLIIGHSRGTPEAMRRAEFCQYDDVVAEVGEFLAAARDRAIAAGVNAEKIYLDPCPGFAKTAEQDWELLRRLPELRPLGRIVVAHSRKSFLGKLIGESEPLRREAATLTVSIHAALQGAAMVRVHDVKATHDAWQVLRELKR